MIILQMLGCVLLGLLALLIVLLLWPVAVLAEYKSGVLTARLRVLFLTFSLFSSAAQPKKKKEKTAQPEADAQTNIDAEQTAAEPQRAAEKDSPSAQATPNINSTAADFAQSAAQTSARNSAKQKDKKPKKAKQKAFSLHFDFDEILAMIPAASAAMRMIMRGIRIKRIKVFLPVCADDPAATAIRYGRVQAYLGGALGVLRNAMHLQVQKLQIVADFNNEFADKTYFYCKIEASPIIMVIAVVYFLVRK